MCKPSIILWDIETSFNAVAAFQLRNDDTIHHSNILTERYIICASWKELGSSVIRSVAVTNDKERFKKDPHDDYHVVKTLHDMLSKADIIVAHNGDRFDLPWFNARAIYHGFPPLPKLRAVDTLKVARHHFKFNSNRLDYLAKFLGVGAKQSTSAGLWLRCFKGERGGIREMVSYNKADVDVLEKVYMRLRPYMTDHPKDVESSRKDLTCRACYGNNLQKRGFYRTLERLYQRYQCQDCGSWMKGTRIIK